MKPKRKFSQREVWLVSLLPAALAAVVALALPGPSSELAAAERRMNQLTGGGGRQVVQNQVRELETQIKERGKELAELDARAAHLHERLRSLQAPVAARKLDMAAGLDELSRRLGGHGVQVLATTEESGSERSRGWKVSVAATWPALRAALAQSSTFPEGLTLSALRMEAPRPDVVLRRWELVVAAAGGTP